MEVAASPPAGPPQPGAAQPAAPAAAAPAAQTETFGRLEPAKVRDYWVDEARDFTPWLAKEENLGLLADTLSISLELVGTEQRVGPFKADIVAKDGEDTVIIENQLDPTDHKHLGQLLVYAAGRNATTVVWVAKQVTDEYRKVIDWLNEQTNVNFWALEIELWRIGDSPVAPKFNVVCEPNELTKSPDGESTELSDTRLLQLEFWKGFSEYLESAGSSFNARKAQPAHWYDLPIGTSRAHIYLNALVQGGGRVACGLYIKTSQSDLIFETLDRDREAIDAELGMADVEWDPIPEKTACRIGIQRQANLADRDSWPELFAWLKDNAEKFKTVFSARVKGMPLPATGAAQGTAGAAEVAEALAAPAAGDGPADPTSGNGAPRPPPSRQSAERPPQVALRDEDPAGRDLR